MAEDLNASLLGSSNEMTSVSKPFSFPTTMCIASAIPDPLDCDLHMSDTCSTETHEPRMFQFE